MSRAFFEKAYRRFWDHLDSQQPRDPPRSYDLCQNLEKARWSVTFVGLMVEGELRESINLVNAWTRHLLELEAWSTVLRTYSEDDAWSLRTHFVEPAVYYCMLQPSSTRDRLAQVATNGIHQANLRTVPGYKDELKQDKLRAGRFLGRKEAENQLAEIGKHWIANDRLLRALRSLDSEEHRENTLHYRNEASHFIAPRLELGEVQIVTRDIVPDQKIIERDDGTCRFEDIPNTNTVSYRVGGIRPLTLAEVIESNSLQLQLAKKALEAYSAVLREALTAMDKLSSPDARKN
jgi:hypothetical protein